MRGFRIHLQWQGSSVGKSRANDGSAANIAAFEHVTECNWRIGLRAACQVFDRNLREIGGVGESCE
jgi:hypothetical protein